MSTNQFGVGGLTCMITGASSGIGKTIAQRFAADGADVAICSRESENVDPVAAAITESDRPGSALATECDVTDRKAVERFVRETVEKYETIDCLINNAGASFMANFDDISPNGWETVVNINLTGTVNCTQVAGEYLKDGGGTVINVSSVAGQVGAPYMSHYGAAKAAIENLSTTLAYEWASDGVRVNCIAPGFVATPGVQQQMGITADEIDRTVIDKRIGATEEIADIAQFLASPASSFIVGETVTAQGVPDVMETP